MLVVSRKVGERILIGDKIVVTVVKVGSGGVRIGIEAPAEMPVMREELAVQILQEERDRLLRAKVPCAESQPAEGNRPSNLGGNYPQ